MTRLPVLLVIAAATAAGPAPQDDDDQKGTALFRVHSSIDQLVDKADGLAAAGKFDEALEIYHEAQKSPNSVVAVAGKGAAPERFVGVLEFCLRRIASWPPEGRAAARRHSDPLAGQAFRAAKAARDPQGLVDVALRFPHSSVADDALSLLGNLHFDAGRFAEAARAFDRLLALPDTDTPRAVAFARLGEALARSGRADAVATLAERARRELPGASVVLGDRQVALADALKAAAEAASSVRPDAALSSSWEMMQGSPSGVRVAEAAAPGFRQWTARLDETRFMTEEDAFGGFSEDRPDSEYRPVVPVVSDGIVYFHTEFAVQAWNLYADATEPLWVHRLPQPAGELMHEDRLSHSTTVSDGRVFVNLVTALGQREVQSSYIHVKFPFPKRALFALDAYTGRVLWRLGGVGGAERFEDSLSFSTAPTPAGGLLYVGAIRQLHSTDPFEHHMLCLDPATGRLLWSTFVASGGTEINLFGNSTRESLGSPVSVEGESVYYGTNHGAFAALDRMTGRLKWVSRYRQLPVRPTRQINIRRHPLGWVSSAPVVARGLVLYTPTDSRYLYAFDAASGEALWWRERNDKNRAIAGCDGTNLVLCGDGVEWLDLTKGGKLVARYSPAGVLFTGRAAVAADGVYLPTKEGLYRVALGLGDSLPYEFGPWRGSGNPGGNVVVAEGAVIAAGPTAVEAFVNRAAVDAAVETELKQHPDRADVVYRAALRLLQAGKSDRAVELLGRVIELVAGSPRPADARLERSARKRLFAIAKSAGAAALAAGRPAEAHAFFQRAAKAAPDPSSVVEAAALLADTAVARGDHAAAIAEYQRLIKESGSQFVGGVRVFDLARSAISKIVAAAGRDPYKRFEEDAAALLKRALASDADEALLDVYRSYPNSLAAERAILAAAEAQAKRGRSDEAAATLRLFLREVPGSERTLDVQAALVLQLEKKGRFASAATVLRRMSAAAPGVEATVEGRRVAVAEFVGTRLARDEYKRADATAAPVRLSPPIEKKASHTEKEFPFGAAVLRPDGPAIPEAASTVLLNFGGAVKGVDAASGTETWRLPTELPVRTSFSFDGAVLFCSDSSITRVKPGPGTVEWKHTAGSPLKGFCRAGAMLCYLTADPRAGGASTVVALDPVHGSVAWSRDFPGLALTGLASADDHVAVVATAPHRIEIFDAETGATAQTVPLSARGPGLRIVAAQQGMIVLHSDESGLQAFEIPSGLRRWWERLDRWSVTVMAASRAGLLVAGTERGQPAAILLDPRSGKRRGVAESLDGVPVAPVSMNDRLAAFAVRQGDRNLGVRALDLADSRLKFAWTAPPRRGRLQSIPLLAAEHAAILQLSSTEDGKFAWGLDLLDAAGRPVQNIGSDSPLERPPAIALANDALILLVENRVEVYR